MDNRKFIAESQQGHEGERECTPDGIRSARGSLSRRGPPRSEAITSQTSKTTKSHHTRSDSAATQALKPVDDDWKPVVDNTFAGDVFYHLFLTSDVPECQLPFTTDLCKHCDTFTGVTNLR